MAQACARLCYQRRHLLNDVGGNGESGEKYLKYITSTRLFKLKLKKYLHSM